MMEGKKVQNDLNGSYLERVISPEFLFRNSGEKVFY